jgi:hypothetical protein
MSVPYQYSQYADALWILLRQVNQGAPLTYPVANAIGYSMNNLYQYLKANPDVAPTVFQLFNQTDGGILLTRFCIPWNNNKPGNDVTLGILQGNLYRWLKDSNTNFYQLFQYTNNVPSCYTDLCDTNLFSQFQAFSEQITAYADNCMNFSPGSNADLVASAVATIARSELSVNDGYLSGLWHLLGAQTVFNKGATDIWTLSQNGKIDDALGIFGENNKNGGFLSRVTGSSSSDGGTVYYDEYSSNPTIGPSDCTTSYTCTGSYGSGNNAPLCPGSSSSCSP